MPEKKSRVQALKEQLEAAERSKDRATFDVPFRSKRQAFPKINVKVDFPLYRIQSGRTHRKQAEYLERHKKPKEFFSDPEDPRVQKAQEEILLQLIDEEGLAADLEEHGQHTPIVLTYDGTIVDGNRRIAALRRQEREYVTAVVLPSDATSAEVYETELELQMSKETKAVYHWIDELLHIRYGIDELKEKVENIAKRLRLDKDEVVQNYKTLTTVDLYLAWAGIAQQYHKVPDDGRGGMKQAFTDLTERLESKSIKRLGGVAKGVIRDACFAAIQKQAGYKQIRSIISNLSTKSEDVLKKLGTHTDVTSTVKARETEKAKDVGSSSAEGDVLEKIAETDVNGTPESLAAIGTLFKEPGTAAKAASSLLRAVEELDEEEKEAKQKDPVELIDKASALLDKVELSSETKDVQGVAKALARVDDHVERLSKQIERVRKEKRVP